MFYKVLSLVYARFRFCKGLEVETRNSVENREEAVSGVPVQLGISSLCCAPNPQYSPLPSPPAPAMLVRVCFLGATGLCRWSEWCG